MTRILIVDDKEENLYYLQALLVGNGYSVDSARHGAEALVKARQAKPDAVISDLLMPVMDGYTLLREWKADERLKLSPFLVYTATYTEPEDEQLALNLGADAFILKPAEPEAFLARLKLALAGIDAGLPQTPKQPLADEHGHLREYSEALIRKLEEKTRLLEETNRALTRDIAARERAEALLRDSEAKLRQAQKMEAIGQLAGGVAHDFNNLLSVIIGYAKLSEGALPPDDPIREDLEEISKAAERASELTRQLLAFGRKQLLEPRVVDLNQILLAIEKMLRSVLGASIDLSCSTSQGACKVLVDPLQVEQVVLNLVVNARDAMPQGGSIQIEIGKAELDASYAAGHVGATPGSYVVLSVVDSGQGMDAATCARIFEPFYTTKEHGKGTGLGLSTVWGIVTQSGGHVEVRSALGAGTTFKLYFPRVERELDVLPVESKPGFVRRGTESILLVEDDEQLRALITDILQRSGYRVLDAANGGEAFLLSERHQGTLHLLLTDVVLPRMNGPELAKRVAASHPTMKVLYVSGYAENAVVHQGIIDSGVAFLAKPITPDSLLRKVREVLDAR